MYSIQKIWNNGFVNVLVVDVSRCFCCC